MLASSQSRGGSAESGKTSRFALSPELLSDIAKASDLCLVVVAAIFSFAVSQSDPMGDWRNWDRYGLSAVLGAVLFVIGCQESGGYDLTRRPNLRRQLVRTAAMWGAVFSGLLFLAFASGTSNQYRGDWALGWAVAAFGFLALERGFLHVATGRRMVQAKLRRHVVVVGAGVVGQTMLEKLAQSNDGGIAVVGVFDDRRTRIPTHVAGFAVLGTTDHLLRFARQRGVDEIIIALPLSAQRLKVVFDKLCALPVDLSLNVQQITETVPARGVARAGGAVIDKPIKNCGTVVKRVEDAVLATLLLALFAPASALIALAIKLESRGPVLFRQERRGFNNRTIEVLKFRTLHVDRTDPSSARRTAQDDQRLTRVGRWLRAFSLDELPQLINVVRGDMSLVGPRPHAVAMRAGDCLYHVAVSDYGRRHRVKPGITGWAQVNGLRGEADSLEKARQRLLFDLDYIDHWSLWFDVQILLMSLRELFRRETAD